MQSDLKIHVKYENESVAMYLYVQYINSRISKSYSKNTAQYGNILNVV